MVSGSDSLIRHARHTRFVTAEEERRLFHSAAAGDKTALDQLIMSHLQVVFKIACRYGRFGLSSNDLIQEGIVGLIQAVRKFNPDRHARLATYAMWWVQASIQEYIVRSWSLVRVGKTAAHRALFFHLHKRAVHEKITTHGNDEDFLTSLARRFRLPLVEVALMISRITKRDAYSLDGSDATESTSGSGYPLMDRLADEQPTPEEALDHSNITKVWHTLIERALALLPSREALIIRERYLSDAMKTLESLGHELGLSKGRVLQLESRALERLSTLLTSFASSYELNCDDGYCHH